MTNASRLSKSVSTPMKPARIARRMLFSTAHLYRQKQFSADENRERFGRCYTEHGHGHNYVLEIFLEGSIDTDTGLVMNLAEVDRILKTVVDPLDHRHLNFDIPEFKDMVPTTENIALYLRSKVLEELSSHSNARLSKIRLYETDDLWVEIVE